MFRSRRFNRFPAIRSSWCIREAHRRWHRRKSSLKMDELENEKVNMIYAETQRGGSSLRWWGAPLEPISAERRSTGWGAIRLHHSSSLYCLPTCEWQESRRHLCAYNLACTHEALTACLGVLISFPTIVACEGIFLTTGDLEPSDFQWFLGVDQLLCANEGLPPGTEEEDLDLFNPFLNSDICLLGSRKAKFSVFFFPATMISHQIPVF